VGVVVVVVQVDHSVNGDVLMTESDDNADGVQAP
jgi:hypothetical protein